MSEMVEMVGFHGQMTLSRDDGAWQPIATAPKDGQIMLLTNGYDETGRGGWVSLGCWVRRLYGEGEAWHNSALIHEIYPTHWMPLPEPPNE